MQNADVVCRWFHLSKEQVIFQGGYAPVGETMHYGIEPNESHGSDTLSIAQYFLVLNRKTWFAIMLNTAAYLKK